MTLLYYDPVFLTHNTGKHPECADRIVPVIRHLNFVALDTMCRRPTWQPATLEQIGRVHGSPYVASVEKFAAQGGGYLDPDTVVSPVSYDVARMAAGAACDAVDRVLRGEDRTAFCLVRPPGHHALPNEAMGFCLFNNVAIASRVATAEHGLERVLIVDWDVHHGNGTQDIFWEDPQVGFLSIHRYPFYPGTGAASEIGEGKGRGTTVNLPIAYGTPVDDYLDLFRTRLSAFAAQMRPQLVLISAGFDAHRDDPVGSLGLSSDDFLPLTQAVLEVADKYAAGRCVSLLEGGYNPFALAESVGVHLEALVDHRGNVIVEKGEGI